MEAILFITLFYVPTLVLLVSCWIVRDKPQSALLMLVSWLVVVAILVIIGAVQHKVNSGYKSTLTGYIVSLASSVLLTGPCLVLITRAKLNPAWAIVGFLILPLVSFVAGMFITESLGLTWAL